MEAENKRKTRLQKLSGSDFEIADGQPDIRGWDVKDSFGKRLGEVDELIFDYQSRKVRYLVVDLDQNDDNMDAKEVLVPIGIAELHENEDDVILPGVMPDQLQALPEYVEDRFDTEQEASVRNVFGGLGGTAITDAVYNDDFYNHDHFNEASLYRKRNNGMVDDGSGLPVKTDSHEEGGINPGGVRLRSRSTNEEALGDIDTRNPVSKDKGDKQDVHPIL